MHIGYHKWYSERLGQDMELKLYGHAGKPILVFPTQEGRFFEYEDFGMIEVCRPFIEAGQVRFLTIDSIDAQTWTHPQKPVPERVERYEEYEQYVLQEVLPFLREDTGFEGRIGVTGCSMGAYHAANFFFRHPERFDALLSISGIYSLKLFLGNYMDDLLYYHTPLAYLKNLNDPKTLELYRQSQIIISVGQGAWEDPMLDETRELQKILQAKQVPCWVDYWGYDVNHDWPWWRKKMTYFLMHMDLANA